MTVSTIEQAIQAIARGEMVVIVDDENRENEGDVIIASDAVTPQSIAFMMNHARGLVCVSIPGERLDELDIPLMVSRNTESLKTAFTVSVDYLHCPSSNILGHFRRFLTGGSGSSGLEFKLLADDAASVCV